MWVTPEYEGDGGVSRGGGEAVIETNSSERKGDR